MPADLAAASNSLRDFYTAVILARGHSAERTYSASSPAFTDSSYASPSVPTIEIPSDSAASPTERDDPHINISQGSGFSSQQNTQPVDPIDPDLLGRLYDRWQSNNQVPSGTTGGEGKHSSSVLCPDLCQQTLAMPNLTQASGGHPSKSRASWKQQHNGKSSGTRGSATGKGAKSDKSMTKTATDRKAPPNGNDLSKKPRTEKSGGNEVKLKHKKPKRPIARSFTIYAFKLHDIKCEEHHLRFVLAHWPYWSTAQRKCLR